MDKTKPTLLAAIISALLLAGLVVYASPNHTQIGSVVPKIAFAQTDDNQSKIYWFAECSSWPLNDGQTAAGYTQIKSSIGSSVWILFTKNGKRLSLQGSKLGSYDQGWYVYLLRGPSDLFDAMKLVPTCRNVIRVKDAWSVLPQAAKNWIKQRSVCNGSALLTANSKQWTLKKWPCFWETARNNANETFNASEITSISPGVLYGGGE